MERKDVTLEAWQILKIMRNIESQGGRVTLGMMADLIRGAGGGSFGTSKSTGNSRKGKGKSKEKEKAELDLDGIAGGKVGLNKDVSFDILLLYIRKTCVFASCHMSLNLSLAYGVVFLNTIF